jgi:tetratricopeptide (TPR) repeat protein
MHQCLTSLIILACALSPTSVARAAQDDGPPSIETLIERYRAEREAATEALRPEVERQISRLRNFTASERYIGSTATIRAALVKLGSGIVPLLIEKLDPKGEKASEQRLSSQLAMVLMDLNLESAIDPLLKIARDGSRIGKELATRVLGACAAPRRVNETLITLYTEQKEISRITLLTALARLESEEGLTFVKERIRSDDVEEGKAAITALAAAASATAGPEIMALALSPSDAAKYIQQICAYYRACGSVFNRQHAEALLQLTESKRLSIEDRIALLNILIENEKHWPSDAKRTLKQMADTGNMQLREAVLVGLALTGDRGAKNDLIRSFEDAIKENPLWSDSYVDLADIQYKVRDYRDAKKNYERALGLGRISGGRKRQVHLGLARCCAIEKKYKDAEKWLKSGLSNSQILEQAGDPAFASMKEHAKYGKVFQEGS